MFYSSLSLSLRVTIEQQLWNPCLLSREARQQQYLGAAHGFSPRAASGCVSVNHVNTQCWAGARGGSDINWLTPSSEECFELGPVILLLLVFLFQSVLVFVWNHGALFLFSFSMYKFAVLLFELLLKPRILKCHILSRKKWKRNSSGKGLFFFKQAFLLVRGSKNNQPSPVASHLLPFQNN